MSPALLFVNGLLAVVAAAVVVHWHRARGAVGPGADGALSVRLRHRPGEDDLVERWADRGLGEAGLLPAGAGRWADRRGRVVPVHPPVTGDRSVLIEVPEGLGDAVVAALVAAALDDGYELSRRRARRVVLRRGPDRLVLELDRG